MQWLRIDLNHGLAAKFADGNCQFGKRVSAVLTRLRLNKLKDGTLRYLKGNILFVL